MGYHIVCRYSYGISHGMTLLMGHPMGHPIGCPIETPCSVWEIPQYVGFPVG